MTSFIGTVLGPGNHVEVGSAIRSTAAFGWGRVFIEDRKQVWFGCDRAIRSEGRAAARRGRNEITCIPCPAGASHAFAHVTIITTQPNALMESIHDRMPVILSPDASEQWLDTSLHDEHALSSLLVPYPAEEMTARAVSRLVNDPRREGAELIA